MGVHLGSHCSSINLAEKLMCLHFKALVMGRYFLPSDRSSEDEEVGKGWAVMKSVKSFIP